MIVCLCGSFRFYQGMLEIKQILEAEGLLCLAPEPFVFRNAETPSEFTDDWNSLPTEEKLRLSKIAEVEFLNKIDSANVIYVVNPGSYIGSSVTMEIGYAFAKGKKIIALEPIDDLTVMGLVDGVVKPTNLVDEIGRR